MLFNTLYFVSLPVGQDKPKNSLPKAISACIRQAGKRYFQTLYHSYNATDEFNLN